MGRRRINELLRTAWAQDAGVREWARGSVISPKGAKISGAKIVCVTCRKSAHFACPGTRPSADIANGFRSMGWQVGGGPLADKCPDCSPKTSRSAANKIISDAKKVVRLVSSTTQENAVMIADKPPEMGVDEALIIREKLHEVYLGADRGYAEGWTDKKVADGLSLPAEWVKRVRHKVFGAGLGDNEDIRDLLGAVGEALKEVRSLNISAAAELVRIQDLEEKRRTLERKVEHLQKRADEIRKAVA